MAALGGVGVLVRVRGGAVAQVRVVVEHGRAGPVAGPVVVVEQLVDLMNVAVVVVGLDGALGGEPLLRGDAIAGVVGVDPAGAEFRGSAFALDLAPSG